jgi:RND family efflux transporter MFP subunit
MSVDEILAELPTPASLCFENRFASNFNCGAARPLWGVIMPRFLKVGVSLAVLLLPFALAGCQPEEPVTAPPRAVRVIEADPQEVPFVAEGSGTIEARTTVNVGFLVDGRMQSRDVDIGSIVKVGDLIAKLDPTDMQNQLDSANAAVTAAQASVDQATPQEAAKKKLLADGYTTRAEYDQALKALQSAQADLLSAQANQRLAQSQLQYTTLLAPVAGVITQTGADAGQVLSAGQMVVAIAENSRLDAVFSVPARIAAGAKPGAPVEVTLQDDPSVKTTGSLREIAPSPDPITGTYTVRISLADPPTRMRLGALVNGRAEVPGEILVRLPPAALLQIGDTPEVWIVGSDGVVGRKSVTVARYDSDAVYVSNGLEKGDVVVVAGVNSLANGQKVTTEKVTTP